MQDSIGSRVPLAMRLGLWGVGFLVVLVFSIVNLGFDLSLSTFNAPETSSDSSVDQSVYLTSRTLAGQAATPQEQHFAVLAMRAADHELDQSFATAIRNSSSRRVVLPASAIAVLRHTEEVKAQIKTDQAQIDLLQKNLDPEQAEGTAEQLRVAQAQLALDNDELDNLQQDFAQLGGNKQQAVQQAFDQHRAFEGHATAMPQNTAVSALESSKNLRALLGKFRILQSLKERRKSLLNAEVPVGDAISTLRHQHDELEVKSENLQDHAEGRNPKQSAAVANLQFLSDRQKDLADAEGRIRELGQLRAVYDDWEGLLVAQIRISRPVGPGAYLSEQF